MSLIDDFYLPDSRYEPADRAPDRGYAHPHLRAAGETIAIQRLVSYPGCRPSSAPSPPSSC